MNKAKFPPFWIGRLMRGRFYVIYNNEKGSMRLWEDTPVEASCKIIVPRLKLTGPLRSSIPGTFLGLLLTLRKDQFYGDNKMLFVSMFLQRCKKSSLYPGDKLMVASFAFWLKRTTKAWTWAPAEESLTIPAWSCEQEGPAQPWEWGRVAGEPAELLRLKVERTYPLGFEPDKNSPSFFF